jgi:hypothetical protein
MIGEGEPFEWGLVKAAVAVAAGRRADGVAIAAPRI